MLFVSHEHGFTRKSLVSFRSLQLPPPRPFTDQHESTINMERNLAAQAGGKTVFEKFRNGFKAVQSEVNKLERITAATVTNQTNLPETTYFSAELGTLQNIGSLHVIRCMQYSGCVTC